MNNKVTLSFDTVEQDRHYAFTFLIDGKLYEGAFDCRGKTYEEIREAAHKEVDVVCQDVRDLLEGKPLSHD